MATLTIRDLEDDVKARLRMRAAANGRSMEAEVRAILRSEFGGAPDGPGLGTRIHERFAQVGGAPLPDVDRSEPPRAAELPE